MLARGVCVFFWTLWMSRWYLFSVYHFVFVICESMNRDDLLFGLSHLRHNFHSNFILLTSRPHWVWLILTLAHSDHTRSSGGLRVTEGWDEGSGWHGTHGAGAGETKMKTLLLPATAHTALRCTLCTGCLPGLYTRCVHIIKLSLSLDITCCYYWQQILPLGLDIRPTVDTAKPWITLTIKSSEQTTSVWNGCVGGTYHIRS